MSYLYRYTIKRKNGNGTVDIRVNTISDLVDDKNEKFKKNNNFVSFRELFNKSLVKISTVARMNQSKNYLALKMARMIVAVFCEVLMEKVIDEHETYKLPFRFFGCISVRDSGFQPKTFVFKPYTMGIDYRMMIDLEPGAVKRVHKMGYYIEPTKRWKTHLEEKLKKGERY